MPKYEGVESELRFVAPILLRASARRSQATTLVGCTASDDVATAR